MRDILRQSNLDLLREIDRLREILHSVSVYNLIPSELHNYYSWAVSNCDSYHQHVVQNLHDLDLEQDDILLDILSSTQEVTREFHWFNRRLVSPILRARHSDRLCLKLLQWLHSVHPRTRGIPVALSDEDFASWPIPSLPTIYFMPCSTQHGLLYLPILFHEFGHLLYACHNPEMDDLVSSLQEQIGELLMPTVQRDDLYTQAYENKRSMVVETWYEWTQELFCDAVGYVIGGIAFAHSFSMYLRMRGQGEYHLPSEKLARREHPVTWLRIRILADRARRMGYNADAEMLETVWGMIAEAMDVTEDYYGFYIPDFLPVIQNTIDDMLTEAEPYRFSATNEQELTPSETSEINSTFSSPVLLLNQAWQTFLDDPNGYRSWEERAIDIFLASRTQTSKE